MVLFYLTKKTVKWQGLVGYLQHSYICRGFGCFTIANGEVIYFQLDSVNKLRHWQILYQQIYVLLCFFEYFEYSIIIKINLLSL